ncbi:MAG: hypothetical protein HQK70_12760 [Desulfamplus sp.]|nr:hypothetical protein [Desulfamplus sp.]
MSLKDYLADMTEVINEYSQTGFVILSEIVSDFRTEKIGFVKGKIIFSDESVLFFREYLDLRYRIDKKSYSFHYQDLSSNLLFRYDNALHKPALGFNDHKHIGDKIIFTDIPNIKDVLVEIVIEYLSS